MFFFAFSLLYIEPEMEAGGRFGERFKMRALRPFWSRRELFMMTWPMQTLSSVPVFLDSADLNHTKNTFTKRNFTREKIILH